ncbi:MAG: ABC transporter permease, partial [Syntrophomonadaceae bacterium]|nr:ABC transporter permease [Syntrophomonadaceae bacterium]
TDWFVRWPFFIEGVFLGTVGGLIAILVLAAGYGSLINHMDALLFLPLVTNPKILSNVYIGLLICGAVLGVLGTWVSLNRFLDV